MELQDQIAIVTGGSRGIGKAIAEELAAAGARVVVNYNHSADAANELAERIGGLAVQADVSTTEGCEALLAAAEALGPTQIVVNNAGITRDGLLVAMSDDDYERVMAINSGGCFRMMREATKVMMRRRSGSIINLTSISGLRGNAGQVNYSASKAAIIGMTRSLAKEIAKRKVRVNAVAPGFIETDMTAQLNPLVIDGAKKLIPMRRLGQVADVAPLVRFLAGPSSTYITGQVFTVDGGMSC